MDEEQQEKQKKEDLERVAKAVQVLSEFFDSVQIFTTRYDSASGLTTRVSKGTGNWFTRYGQVKYWVLQEDETPRIESREDYKPEN